MASYSPSIVIQVYGGPEIPNWFEYNVNFDLSEAEIFTLDAKLKEFVNAQDLFYFSCLGECCELWNFTRLSNCIEVSGKCPNFHFLYFLEIQKIFGTKKKESILIISQPWVYSTYILMNIWIIHLYLLLLILEYIQNLSTICMDDFRFHWSNILARYLD